MQTPRAALLSIGTEVTSGQIINTNASKIAKDLTDLGLDVVLHMAVQDEMSDITNAMDFARPVCNWMFLTGGLGPTSDDITRNAVATWSQRKLVWSDEGWKHVVDRLTSRGREPKDVHRTQAQFPEHAILLLNRSGTACGFVLENAGENIGENKLFLVVLPGPPKEIDMIWNDHLQDYIRHNIPEKRIFLFTWLCEGRGESEFAEITERIFAGSGLRIGYRLIDRSTEIKVWVPKELESKAEPLRTELTLALGTYLVQKMGPV